MTTTEINSQIETALNSIRPYLEADGGGVELVEVDENLNITLRLTGNCSGCEMSGMTMRAGIEETLRKSIPQVGKITAVNGK